MRSLPLKAVAFDMDGLLLNTEELYDQVGTELVERRGRTLNHELIKNMMGRPARVSLQLMIDFYGFSDSIDELQAETDEIFAAILPDQLAPMLGAVELLERLTTRGTPKALTTSSRRAFVDRAMTICDLRSHFGFQLTAEDVEQGKPAPEIYEKAAARFGIEPSQMLVFEDSENGCRAGVAAGAHVVAVPSKHSHLHDFTGATIIAENLADRRIYEMLCL